MEALTRKENWMTLHLKDLLADILQQRPKISLAELAALLEEEVEAQVQDRIAELREQLEFRGEEGELRGAQQ
jgi:hypothetical protein